jgi:hypothetical protein
MSFATNWLRYFERNRSNRVTLPPQADVAVEPDLRGPLVRSMQRFQLGEQGDGMHLRRGAIGAGDATYAAAIALFVQEEQEHARLLASLLAGLNAPLLRWHWSDVCFTLLRRLLGLRWEVLVLMVAELIGKRYYQALHERLQEPTLRRVFGQIMHDEVGHIAFHTDFLQRAFGSQALPVRVLVCATWWLLFRCVCQVVVCDHASLLRAIDLAPAEFRRDCCALADELVIRVIAGVRHSVLAVRADEAIAH